MNNVFMQIKEIPMSILIINFPNYGPRMKLLQIDAGKKDVQG